MRIFEKLPHHLFETERFKVESLVPRRFAAETLHWTNDPDVMAGIGLVAGGWPLRRWQRYFTARQHKNALSLGIWPKGRDNPIGYHTAILADRRVAMIGIVIGEKEWWGRGVVMEVRPAVLDFLFNTVGVDRAWGLIAARNFASIGNYRALGFAHEGTLRKHGSGVPGDRSDMLAFGILKSEWLASRESD